MSCGITNHKCSSLEERAFILSSFGLWAWLSKFLCTGVSQSCHPMSVRWSSHLKALPETVLSFRSMLAGFHCWRPWGREPTGPHLQLAYSGFCCMGPLLSGPLLHTECQHHVQAKKAVESLPTRGRLQSCVT